MSVLIIYVRVNFSSIYEDYFAGLLLLPSMLIGSASLSILAEV